ncbi:MAG: polysaccharide biosynthesis protein, partial [Lachnospiraceae bacterium]|nr:polysaccharide biosynthesis protein [Lachnospiraceae bacterium]
MFDLSRFVSEHVIKRKASLFEEDIKANKDELTKKIEGKSVLVIGGAGSIGSSFVKAVLPYKPRTLIVVDINENGLAELTRDLRSMEGMFVPDDYIPYPMDFASAVFEKMFRARGGFDIVANFSAHKHVRSEKDIYSVEAMLQNNVLHAKKLLDLLTELPPEEYFCVST